VTNGVETNEEYNDYSKIICKIHCMSFFQETCSSLYKSASNSLGRP